MNKKPLLKVPLKYQNKIISYILTYIFIEFLSNFIIYFLNVEKIVYLLFNNECCLISTNLFDLIFFHLSATIFLSTITLLPNLIRCLKIFSKNINTKNNSLKFYELYWLFNISYVAINLIYFKFINIAQQKITLNWQLYFTANKELIQNYYSVYDSSYYIISNYYCFNFLIISVILFNIYNITTKKFIIFEKKNKIFYVLVTTVTILLLPPDLVLHCMFFFVFFLINEFSTYLTHFKYLLKFK